MQLRKIEELRRDYRVLASFYKYKWHEELLLRNVADVMRKSEHILSIDAYLVMMNPWSCRPVDKDNIQIIGKCGEIKESMSLAIDDPAQKVVMQLMDNMHRNRVRILNLSDISCWNSTEALKLMKWNWFLWKEQSVFYREDIKKITVQDAPVIFAWWVNNFDIIWDYVQKAYDYFDKPNYSPYWIKKEDSRLAYYYLKPMTQKQQIEIMWKLLEQLNINLSD